MSRLAPWRRTRLSIFGDHSDVMAVPLDRVGDAVSRSVQEAQDFALDRARGTLEVARALRPFLRRIPHIARNREDRALDVSDVRAMIDERLVAAHRARALTPDRPGHPRHRAEPRRVLPESRSGATRATWRTPAIVSSRDEPICAR